MIQWPGQSYSDALYVDNHAPLYLYDLDVCLIIVMDKEQLDICTCLAQHGDWTAMQAVWYYSELCNLLPNPESLPLPNPESLSNTLNTDTIMAMAVYAWRRCLRDCSVMLWTAAAARGHVPARLELLFYAHLEDDTTDELIIELKSVLREIGPSADVQTMLATAEHDGETLERLGHYRKAMQAYACTRQEAKAKQCFMKCSNQDVLARAYIKVFYPNFNY